MVFKNFSSPFRRMFLLVMRKTLPEIEFSRSRLLEELNKKSFKIINLKDEILMIVLLFFTYFKEIKTVIDFLKEFDEYLLPVVC